MIRVTYKNCEVYKYYKCLVEADNNEIFLFDNAELSFIAKFNDIVKIEKQVKDLTLSEMGKLYLAEKYTDGNFTELEGAVHLETYKIYKLDDYIDITDLIKERS